MAPLGYDPVGSIIALLFLLLAVLAALIGIAAGGVTLLVTRRYRRA